MPSIISACSSIFSSWQLLPVQSLYWFLLSSLLLVGIVCADIPRILPKPAGRKIYPWTRAAEVLSWTSKHTVRELKVLPNNFWSYSRHISSFAWGCFWSFAFAQESLLSSLSPSQSVGLFIYMYLQGHSNFYCIEAILLDTDCGDLSFNPLCT